MTASAHGRDEDADRTAGASRPCLRGIRRVLPTGEPPADGDGEVAGARTSPWDGVTRPLRSAVRVASTGVGVVRTVVRPAGAVGVAVEGAWVTTHIALYPLGALGRRASAPPQGFRVEHLPPSRRGRLVADVEAAGTPILLVHGLGDNRSVFTVLRRGLRRRGFGQVSTLNYSPLTHDVRAAAARLAEEVEHITRETGYERIHVVGHSLGGLIARYYVTRLGGDERVHTLVTLGTPHSGTHLARLWPSRLCRQLTPGSPLMHELDQRAPGCRTRMVAYWSDLDYAVVPAENAMVRHPDIEARNIKLIGVGHQSLPILPTVVHGISTALAQLGTDGSTVTPGVTDISGRGRMARPVS
jgi:pimeloyl-ACP methyl ester carboxylesterase